MTMMDNDDLKIVSDVLDDVQPKEREKERERQREKYVIFLSDDKAHRGLRMGRGRFSRETACTPSGKSDYVQTLAPCRVKAS